jgi:hypothetical protein
LQSYLGANVDAYRSNETRPILDGLAKIAEDHDLPILILRHAAKNASGRALYRGLGSIDFSGSVRSELFCGRTLDGQTAICHIKSNIGPLGPSQAYEITEADEAGHIWMAGCFRWLGECGLTVGDLTEPEHSREEESAVKETEEFLRESLQGGPKLAKDVIGDARGVGICQRTLERGKQKLGITARKRTGDGRWEWLLPDEKSNKAAKTAIYGNFGGLDSHQDTNIHCDNSLGNTDNTAKDAMSTDVGGLVGHLAPDVNYPAKDRPAKPYKPGISPWTGQPYPPAYAPYKPGGEE